LTDPAARLAQAREPLAQGPAPPRRSTADKPAHAAQTWPRGAHCRRAGLARFIARPRDDARERTRRDQYKAASGGGDKFIFSIRSAGRRGYSEPLLRHQIVDPGDDDTGDKAIDEAPYRADDRPCDRRPI